MAGYVNEIRDCLAAERAPPEDIPLGAGCLELSASGAISYYSDVERNLVAQYLADPRLAYDLIGGGYQLAEAVAGDLGRPSDFGRLYV